MRIGRLGPCRQNTRTEYAGGHHADAASPAFVEESRALLVEEGVATSDQAERAVIYKQASAILNEDLPSLFYYTANVFVGVNKGLTGLKPSSDPGYLTWNIQDWAFTK